MPTSSEESDLRWDRVEAREAHYRQSSQGNPQPPNAKKRIDSIELGLMGTHFEVVSEDESFPARIDDFTDNEAAGPSCGAELKVRRDSIYDQPDSDSSVAKKPIAETGFTPKWGPYLPLSEMIETRRQLLSSKKRPPSLSTTIDPGVHEEQSPTPEHEIHIPLVTNPTPSNRSMCTTREGSCKGEKEFLPPYSWSYYDIKLGRLNGKEAK